VILGNIFLSLSENDKIDIEEIKGISRGRISLTILKKANKI